MASILGCRSNLEIASQAAEVEFVLGNIIAVADRDRGKPERLTAPLIIKERGAHER